MWLLDVCSRCSDVECRGGARQERFQSKSAHRDEYAFTRSQHAFSLSRWSTSLELFCCETPSACSSALMDFTAEMIHLAVSLASWLSHRDDSNRLFGTASPRQFRCDVCLSQSGALHRKQDQRTTRCVDLASARCVDARTRFFKILQSPTCSTASAMLASPTTLAEQNDTDVQFPRARVRGKNGT